MNTLKFHFRRRLSKCKSQYRVNCYWSFGNLSKIPPDLTLFQPWQSPNSRGGWGFSVVVELAQVTLKQELIIGLV